MRESAKQIREGSVKSEPGTDVAESEARIGVFLLRESGEASPALDIPALAEYATHLPGVIAVRTVAASSAMDPEKLAADIRKTKFNTIVLAANHPGFYKPAFTRALSLAGYDGSRVRLASFAERGDVANANRARATLLSAVQGTPFAPEVKPAPDPFNTATLVIGGGVAGIQAALEIAESGNKVYIVERTGTIGGRMAMFDKTFPTLDCAACILTPKMVAVSQNPNIELLVLSEVQEVSGSFGQFQVKVLKHATRVDAAACVATARASVLSPRQANSTWVLLHARGFSFPSRRRYRTLT